MLDPTMIQTRGFHNRADGFELRLRLPYYRGLWITAAECSLADLTASETLRWPVDVPAVLSVPRPKPLAIGFHVIDVDLRLRMSYIPVELQPTIWTEQRRLVITR
jgi:hypothetical protein